MKTGCFFIGLFLAVLGGDGRSLSGGSMDRPNILWLYVEDISPNLSCYGETTIHTPNIDHLAAQGLMFTNAFVTAPVCSPSRSALISGMNQATLGAHNHRSQKTDCKAGGKTAYYESYKLPESIQLLPKLFQEAEYLTVLRGKREGELSVKVKLTIILIGILIYTILMIGENERKDSFFLHRFSLREGKLAVLR